MPDSSELVKNIIYYQKSLDRYSQSREDTKVKFLYKTIYLIYQNTNSRFYIAY